MKNLLPFYIDTSTAPATFYVLSSDGTALVKAGRWRAESPMGIYASRSLYIVTEENTSSASYVQLATPDTLSFTIPTPSVASSAGAMALEIGYMVFLKNGTAGAVSSCDLFIDDVASLTSVGYDMTTTITGTTYGGQRALWLPVSNVNGVVPNQVIFTGGAHTIKLKFKRGTAGPCYAKERLLWARWINRE